jgi:predicted enzyme related to lactoylglutathione lyase
MDAVAATERPTVGTFCWVELGTTDPQAAKAFYSSLFGWTSEDFPMGPDTYTMWKVNGLDNGGMYKLMKDQLDRGIPPHWLLYVAVDDVDRAASKAKGLGANILVGPMDVFDMGRMAVVQDPQGAVFAFWESRKHTGARVADVAGTMCWSELVTRDTDAAKTFYTSLLPWKGHGSKSVDPAGEYTEWSVEGKHIGGMLKMTEEFGDTPPYWIPYFQVSDCQKTVEKAKELGGKVKFGPIPIPNVGDFALISDAQGAHFNVIELKSVA